MQLIHLNWESLSILENEEASKLEYFEFERRHNPHRTALMCKTEGGKLHLLMKQIFLNVPVHNILEHHPILAKCIEQIQLQYKNIPSLNTLQIHQDYLVAWLWENYLIWAQVDICAIELEKSRYHCIDWTFSEGNVPTKAAVQQHWKTQLPLFLLAKSYNVLPENLSFTYWFVCGGDAVVEYKFEYSTAQFNSFFERLHKTLNKLTAMQVKTQEPERYYLQLAEDAPEVEI
ncbi:MULTISPECIES: hypothetical protein [unclassified Microcoleus]|uniref:hypothetical protein n=1 Tax=unclassified Microcoleus TaxID=2642155 RepID=UPI001DE2B313|nr:MULTISPECIES: hypothetical protein [unclassified Microcoleus]MCC3501411.1 hypothetical protein [Microcoleus sp. PH2017_19_SFW_U_A]TAG99321.1 MAG: hypothetical protein EAZ19_00785 [Oscillatoriales cyanobacterium]MCC3473788.1 hypothetical protein [Microcoleus sp. PH2017_13_LAR_U_A]MCC3486225.1 hypothetical protein [Microcoleus sp. PH2017_14_LAR_D_A]MCC3496784.1 hypothetical protein [Microcoleus sp. PH2017_15_JOR_U_A]